MELMAEIAFLKDQLKKERELREKAELQLFYARQENLEKDGIIRELEELILIQAADKPEVENEVEPESFEDEVEMDIDGEAKVEGENDGFEVNDRGSEQLADVGDGYELYTILEEDPDEIPGYYDECISYAESLRIIIGSDSKLPTESESVSPDQGNKSVPKGKKKRKQFKLLFGMAHY